MDDMGIFRTTMCVENPLRPDVIEWLHEVLVDTGSELSWVPTEVLERLGVKRRKEGRWFQMADGDALVRSIGYAIIHAGGTETNDEVVFTEPGDMTLLGAHARGAQSQD